MKVTDSDQILDKLSQAALSGLNIVISSSKLSRFGMEKNVIMASVRPEVWSPKSRHPIKWATYGEGGSVAEALVKMFAKLPEEFDTETTTVSEAVKPELILDPADVIK